MWTARIALIALLLVAITSVVIRAQRCARGEALRSCGTMCEGNCSSPTLPQQCKDVVCLDSGCACDLRNGYVRDECSGKCIHKRKCYNRKPCA